MLIEIFEMKGYPDDELDSLILLLSRSAAVKKINVLDREAMKNHQDVIRLIKTRQLPIIKVDGKIAEKRFLKSLAGFNR
ncbi:MAG: hypothetical protein HYT72_04080 [Candidatus Aenigmarchaeota archaeon]|nr:hypothetical protein [Candidatus Aenigmarchaeota archaeon]